MKLVAEDIQLPKRLRDRGQKGSMLYSLRRYIYNVKTNLTPTLFGAKSRPTGPKVTPFYGAERQLELTLYEE